VVAVINSEIVTEFKNLNACLIALTHQTPPGEGIDTCITFWQQWLDQNSAALKKITPTPA